MSRYQRTMFHLGLVLAIIAGFNGIAHYWSFGAGLASMALGIAWYLLGWRTRDNAVFYERQRLAGSEAP